jgi:5-methylcytosine-specific restriction endonuclease McrA
MTARLREAVRRRARRRCEYCRLPDSALSPGDFHLEHIIARKHGGKSTMGNLAWACIFCNLYKGPNLASFDPDTGKLTPLFNPRTDRWKEHFRLTAGRVGGLTPVGRTSVWLLEMNSEILLTLRTCLIREKRW